MVERLARLDAMGRSWTASALRASAEWTELRRLAAEALRVLDAPHDA